MSEIAELERQLSRVVADGGSDNRVVIDGGRGFVVVRGGQGERSVVVVAAGGRHLPRDSALDAPTYAKVVDTGLRQRTAARPFTGRWPLDTPDAVSTAARKIGFLMREVYGLTGPMRGQLVLGDRVDVQNPGLIKAMTALSKKREGRLRLRVYQQLIEARLLVALARPLRDPRRQDQAELHTFEQLASAPVVGVFTDREVLRAYDPRELPFVVWSGEELVPLLVARRVASLLINPGGRAVRGELYRNELETISEGIQRLRGTH